MSNSILTINNGLNKLKKYEMVYNSLAKKSNRTPEEEKALKQFPIFSKFNIIFSIIIVLIFGIIVFLAFSNFDPSFKYAGYTKISGIFYDDTTIRSSHPGFKRIDAYDVGIKPEDINKGETIYLYLDKDDSVVGYLTKSYISQCQTHSFILFGISFVVLVFLIIIKAIILKHFIAKDWWKYLKSELPYIYDTEDIE